MPNTLAVHDAHHLCGVAVLVLVLRRLYGVGAVVADQCTDAVLLKASVALP